MLSISINITFGLNTDEFKLYLDFTNVASEIKSLINNTIFTF